MAPPKKFPPKRAPEIIDVETSVEVTPRAVPREPTGRVTPPFTIAYILPIQPITIPGAKITPGMRIDPMLQEWADWRIVVAGASVLLIAPPGWTKGVTNAAGLTDEFAPYAAAHDWEGADDVRQVFEIPRTMVMIRYYIDARGGEIDDLAFAEAIKARVIAAPDDKTRAAWAIMEAEAKREAAEMRAEAARAATPRAQPKAPTPTARAKAAPPKAGKPRGPEPLVSAPSHKDDDDDVGSGDPGPDDEDEF